MSALSTLPTYQSVAKSRLQSLYSNFALQKHANPSAYHANIDWWRRTLEAFMSSKASESPNTLVLNVQRALVDKFKYPGVGKPVALGQVISELSNSSRLLIPMKQFMNSPSSVYQPNSLPWRVASYVISKPMWWALEQMSIVSSEEHLTDAELWKHISGDYVMLPTLESVAESVIEQQRLKPALDVSAALYDIEMFKRELVPKGTTLSELDCRVLLRFLQRDKRVIVMEQNMIKFLLPDQEAEGISSVDRGILEVKRAVQNLHGQVDNIQRRIESAQEKVTQNLRQNRKNVALSYLRSRKQLDELLTKRINSLSALESTLTTIEGAAGDIEIMKSYESSSSTLRNILSHPSLQQASIEKTMDAMANATADAKEIDEAIRLGGDLNAASASVDEDELEAELQELVKEKEREDEEKKAQEELTMKHAETGEQGDDVKVDTSESEIGRDEMAARFARLSRRPTGSATGVSQGTAAGNKPDSVEGEPLAVAAD